MSQYLPFDEIKFDNNGKLEDILNTPNDSEIGYFVECVLKYPDNNKQKTKNFPFCPENKFSPQGKFSDYMNQMKSDTYTESKKLICDWTDKKNYSIFFRLLKFYNRQRMVVDKVYDIISCRQSKWLEKYINFNTQKRI